MYQKAGKTEDAKAFLIEIKNSIERGELCHRALNFIAKFH